MCLYGPVSPQTKTFEAAGELLKVLAAPARLAIVTELAQQPRYVHELVDRLGMSQPLVSQHLRVLRGARLVGVERHGREAVYTPAPSAKGTSTTSMMAMPTPRTMTTSTSIRCHTSPTLATPTRMALTAGTK